MVFSFSTVPSRETILRFTSAVPELSPVITRVAPFIVRIKWADMISELVMLPLRPAVTDDSHVT